MQSRDLLQHTDFMYRMAYLLIQDTHLAEDLVQDTLLENETRAPAEVRQPRPWLKGLLRNRALTHIRGETRRRDREKSAALPEKQPSTSELAEKSEVCRIVTDSVSRLEELYRQPLMLRFFQGLSDSEAAESLGVPVETMRTRVKRGLKKVREHLENKYNGQTKRWVMALAPIAGLRFLAQAEAAEPAKPLSTRKSPLRPMAKATAFLVPVGLVLWFMISMFQQETTADPEAKGHPGTVAEAEISLPEKEREQSRVSSRNDRQSLPPLTEADNLIRVQGTTLTRDQGQPVADVSVTPILLCPDKDPEVLEAVTTGPEGIFSIQITKQQCQNSESILLQTRATGFREASSRFHLICDKNRVVIDPLRLDRNPLHEIAIVDSEDKPVSGAKVAFYKWGHTTPLAECTSDSKGMVRMTEEQLERRLQAINGLIIHATAAHKTDYILKGIWGKLKQPFPHKIVLQDSESWIGTVVDANNGIPISGADIQLNWSARPIKLKGRKENALLNEIKGFRAVTDRFGDFSLPRINGDGFEIRIIIQADGYLQKTDRPTCQPHTIHVQKPTDTLPCQAVKADAGFPLAEYRIQDPSGYTVIIDEQGHFVIPAAFNSINPKKRYLLATNPNQAEDQWIYQGSGVAVSDGEGRASLRFEKINGKHHRIRVLDLLGQPIYGAVVELDYHPVVRAFTNKEGVATLSWPYTRPEFVAIRIAHPSFMTAYDTIRLPNASGSAIPTYTLPNTYLFQNLHVLDEEGNPVVNMCVIITIYRDSDSPFEHCLTTNEYGLLDLCLPTDSFKYGLIYFMGEPDIRAVFSLESLLSKKPIILVNAKNSSSSSKIQGTVSDPSGEPMADVSLVIKGKYKDNPWLWNMPTKTDGSFSFTVPSGGLYRLEVSPFLHQDRWYWSEGRTQIQHGENIDLTVQPYRCATAYFHDLPYHLCFNSKTYDARLETPGGQEVAVKVINQDSYRMVVFMGIPEGRFRVRLETQKGDRYSSPLFDVEGFEPVEVEIRP